VLILVQVTVAGSERPPEDAAVRVEVRDTSIADAPAVTLGSATGRVRGRGSWIETVEVDVDDLPDGCTVFAHVDVDGDGRLSAGDYLTTQSYPVPPGPEPRLSVEVRPI
jgi:uncharacterized lipoprotein YbaY